MKNYYILLLLAIGQLNANAHQTCTSNGGNNWATAFSCSGSGQPVVYVIQAGDSVYADVNSTVAMDTLKVYGKLTFKNGSKIDMDSNGIVQVFSGGSIDGGTNGTKIRFANAGDVSGPFNISGPAFTAGGTFTLGSVPVQWLSTSVSASGDQLVVNWSTAMENNNSHFVIEYSADLKWFEELDVVRSQAENGLSHNILSYQWSTESKGLNEGYIRIAQFDFDGTVSYSNPMHFVSENLKSYRFTQSGNTILLSSINGQGVDLDVVNVQGLTLFSSFDCSTEQCWIAPRSGVYILRIRQGRNLNYKKVIIR